MYKKLIIALIVVSTFVIGSTSFRGLPAQASHNCYSNSVVLAANPELAVACRYHDTVTVTGMAVLGANEASGTQDTDLTSSTFLATNPELSILRRYTDATEQGGSQPDPYKRTTDELVRHQNYLALHVHPADPEPNALSTSTLMANPVLSVAQCTVVMEQWNRLNHPGR